MVRYLCACLLALLLLGWRSAAAQTVLLDFSSPFCGPCQQLEPTIHRLTAEGFPIQQVDVTRDVQLRDRYQVDRVPCLVMLVDGQEVERMWGGGDYAAIRQLIERHAAKPSTSLSEQTWNGEGGAPGVDQPPAASATDPNGFAAKLLASSVRLKVQDPDGFGYGTGTIVDTRGADALVITCGHLFRSSGGKGAIEVELFAATPAGLTVVERVAGELISYDDRRDIGLVSIRPSRTVAASRVASQDGVRENDRVWTVGCSRGDNPTLDATRVTDIQHDHVNAAHRPVEGRSGGGLFNEQGQLVGLCTGAYQESDEGLYVNLSTIHGELDRLNLADVYRSQPAIIGNEATSVAASQPAPTHRMTPVPNVAAQPTADPLASTWPTASPAVRPVVNEFPALAPAEQAALEEVARRAVDCEVVVIVRPKDPAGRSEVLTIGGVSPQFVEQLRRMQSPGNPPARLAAQP